MTRWSSISHECRIWTMKILWGMSPMARCKFGTDSSGTSFYTWPLVNLYLTRRGRSWRCHTIITKEGSHFGCDFQVSSRSYPLIFFRTGVAHSYLSNQQPEFWHILPMPCLPHAMAHQPRRQKLPAVRKTWRLRTLFKPHCCVNGRGYRLNLEVCLFLRALFLQLLWKSETGCTDIWACWVPTNPMNLLTKSWLSPSGHHGLSLTLRFMNLIKVSTELRLGTEIRVN